MSNNNQPVLIGELKPVYENPEQVRKNLKIFRDALPKILDPKVDIVMIQGKPFTRKSGWNVTNRYFGTPTKPTSSWRTELPEGEYAWTVVVQAGEGPNAQSRSGTVTSLEVKEKHPGKEFARMEADCHSLAETKAVGRASAAYYMIADVSAEEVAGGPIFSDKENIPEGAKRACQCKEGPDCEKNSRKCKRCGGMDLS